ncbi:hypothetical protein [Pseudoduganella sp.]|uniref:hypothetical protein n=1 Tax=Pseudoduganella sp. TaxID=1880898 RepID=UPI0035B44133
MEDLSEFTFSVPATAQAFTDICAYMDAHNINDPLVVIVTRALYDWMAAQDAARDPRSSLTLRMASAAMPGRGSGCCYQAKKS